MKVEIDPRVDKELRKLSNKELAKILSIIEVFEESGFDITEKHLKKLRQNLWELRTGRWRILFGLVKGKAFIVEVFAKKSQKTPTKEFEVAQKRLSEYL